MKKAALLVLSLKSKFIEVKFWDQKLAIIFFYFLLGGFDYPTTMNVNWLEFNAVSLNISNLH